MPIILGTFFLKFRFDNNWLIVVSLHMCSVVIDYIKVMKKSFLWPDCIFILSLFFDILKQNFCFLGVFLVIILFWQLFVHGTFFNLFLIYFNSTRSRGGGVCPSSQVFFNNSFDRLRL